MILTPHQVLFGQPSQEEWGGLGM